MGFFSKAFKGVKKVFKKVGKAIKSGLKSVGKFMDKIGIVGQIGLSLLLPGVGAMLGSAFQGLTGAMTAYSGVGSTIINGAGNFLAKAGQLAGQVGKSFSSITEGVKNVVGETLKAGANALGLDTAVLKAGETFGSEYLTNLGESIRAADLGSIGAKFGESAEAIVNSFGNIGQDLGGVSSTSSKLTDGAVTPQPENIYDPDIVTTDMPAAQVQTESLLSPKVDVAAPVAGDPSAVVNRQLMTDAEFLETAQPDFTDTTKRGLIGETYDRAVAAGTKMFKEAPTKAIDKLGATITDIPSQMARKAAGLDPDPVFNQTSYATIVPTIDEAPLVGSPMSVNPVQYVASNATAISMEPFGYNANMYNEATYMNQMRKYGFA